MSSVVLSFSIHTDVHRIRHRRHWGKGDLPEVLPTCPTGHHQRYPPLKSSFPSFIHLSHPESSNHIADRALLFVRFFSFIVLIKWTLIRKRWVRRGMSWDRERGD